VTIFNAAGSPADGPQALLADRVSAALTAACLFLVLALVVTLIARPRRHPTADEHEDRSPVSGAHPTRRGDALAERSATA
jgi:hypothetical protein